MECSPEVSVTIDYRKIGAHLRSARKAKSLSQMQFASFLHMSVNSYGNIERGIQKISLLRLFQLCKLFDGAQKVFCTTAALSWSARKMNCH